MPMRKTILVTGASSFLGAHVCEYLARDHRVIGVWHQTPLHLSGVQPLKLNLCVQDVPDRLLAEVDVVVHLAGKIAGDQRHTAYQINRQLMQRVLQMGKPVIYGSSTAVHWTQVVPYVRSRREDERDLIASGLPFSILRPCAPYGPKLRHHTPKHQESFQILLNTIRQAPFVPIIGDGQYLRQPLHVADFAALTQHFINTGCNGEIFDVAGGSVHTFDELIAIMQGAAQTHKPCVHIPKRLATFAARFVPALEPSLISVIDNSESFDISDIQQMVSMRSFKDGVYDLL